MKRIEKLKRLLNENGLDAFLVSSPIDLFYFTGLELSAGQLIVKTEGAELIVDGRYYESCLKKSNLPVFLAKDKVLQEHLEGVSTLGIDSDTTVLQVFLDLQQMLSAQKIKIRPIAGLVKRLRMIKDLEELKLLKEAASLGSEGFDLALSLLKEGISENEIALEVEWFWRKRGASGTAFDPIIAFGENSSMPHYRAGEARLKSGQIVLIDIGVLYNRYHSDMTRVVFFKEVDEEIKKIRDIVHEALLRAVAKLKPGVTIGEVDDAARGYIASKGYGERFTHSLGHGVGLEIHEFPTVRKAPPAGSLLLEEGMVITIEPGIYLPGKGGVRLEDTVAITKDSYSNFTQRAYQYHV